MAVIFKLHVIFGLHLTGMFLMFQFAHAECDNYYVIYERESIMFGDGTGETITPKKPSDVYSSPEHSACFNVSDEYKIIQENLNCILDLRCDDFYSVTLCTTTPKGTGRKSIDIYIPTVTKSQKIIESTTTKTTEPLSTKVTDTTTSTTTIETTTSESTTIESSTSILDITSPSEASTTEDLTTTESIESTTTEDEMTTETTDNNATARQLEMENKKTESMKIAIITTSAVAGGSLVAFLVKKFLDAQKYGSYRIPDTNINESAM